MRLPAISFLAVVFLLFFTSCNSSKEDTQSYDKLYFEARGEAQGTTYSIIYFDSLQRDMKQAVDSILEVIDKSMSTYRKDSYISVINNGDVGFYPVDRHFFEVITLSDSVWRLSGGFFDPTVKPLVNFWKVGEIAAGEDTNLSALDSIMAITGWGKGFFSTIAFSEGNYQLEKKNKYASLDFNAIAQGYTVDVLADFMDANGISDYFIELGGETLTKGKSPRGDCWRIGIEKPGQEENRVVHLAVEACDKALATSGSYRKFTEKNGLRYSHAINPISGKPVQHTLLSISVMAENCGYADALATAVLVMGKEDGMKFLQTLGVAGYFITAGEEGLLEVAQTDNFESYILK